MSNRARATRIVCLIATACAVAGLGPRQPVAPPPPAPTETTAPTQPVAAAIDWSSRLQALSPERPEEYFLLAEEVAGEGTDTASRFLARELYVLALELNKRLDPVKQSPRLAPSVCLGLAAIARRDDERRWLVALAQSLSEPTGFGPSSVTTAPSGAGQTAPETALDVANSIGHARAGEGRRAEALLEKPGVAAALSRLDEGQSSMYSLGSFVNKAIREWPACPQCRNRRAVPSGGKSGEMILCDTCRGNPGPKISKDELIHQLRIESSLLNGTQRSWAAQLVTDGGAPLRDLDISELAATYEVDPAKPLWRNGKWAAKP